MKQQELSHEDEDIETLLALHKLYVEMANAVSQRRDSANRFFLTVATAPFPLLVLAYREYQDVFSSPLGIVVAVVGAMVTFIWHRNLLAYKKLNKAKYKVILEIEAKLPHDGFTREWKLLKADGYPDLTQSEMALPCAGIIIYVGMIIYAIRLMWN